MRKPLDYIFPDPPSGVDPQALNQNAIPRHVAVIMDGKVVGLKNVLSIVFVVIRRASKRYARLFVAQ